MPTAVDEALARVGPLAELGAVRVCPASKRQMFKCVSLLIASTRAYDSRALQGVVCSLNRKYKGEADEALG